MNDGALWWVGGVFFANPPPQKQLNQYSFALRVACMAYFSETFLENLKNLNKFLKIHHIHHLTTTMRNYLWGAAPHPDALRI